MARSSTTFLPGYHSSKSYTYQPGEKNSNAKLTSAIVRRLRRKYYEEKISMQSIADQMGMNVSSIYRMIKGQTYKDVN